MAGSEPSDQIAINDRGEEATWKREVRLIGREISAVDLHLSEGRYVALSGLPDAFQSRPLIMKSYNVRDYIVESASDVSDRDPMTSVFDAF